MKDHVDKTLEAFTFGGDLRIETENDCTMYSLKSSAPILSLDNRPSVSTQLADEVEILLAERRVAWEKSILELLLKTIWLKSTRLPSICSVWMLCKLNSPSFLIQILRTSLNLNIFSELKFKLYMRKGNGQFTYLQLNNCCN